MASFRAVARYALGAFLAVAALNAFGGGLYGMFGAEGVPTAWLEGSPFQNYFVPSVILFFVVGGSMLAAAVAVFVRSERSRLTLAAAGLIALGWITVQVAVIGYVSWLQPAVALIGALLLAVATVLPQSRFSQ